MYCRGSQDVCILNWCSDTAPIVHHLCSVNAPTPSFFYTFCRNKERLKNCSESFEELRPLVPLGHYHYNASVKSLCVTDAYYFTTLVRRTLYVHFDDSGSIPFDSDAYVVDSLCDAYFFVRITYVDCLLLCFHAS